MNKPYLSWLKSRRKKKAGGLSHNKIKINKIQALSLIVVLCILGSGLMLASIVKSQLSVLGRNGKNTSLSQIFTASSVGSNPDTSIDLKNLDFNKVERYEVPNAKATVVYVPQIHREPTSTAQDSVNDNAAVIQKEIAGMLTKLVDKNHIKYVMDETDYYGPMPSDKIKKVEQGLKDASDARNMLSQTIEAYLKNGGDKATADNIKSQASAQIDKYERNIYLTGGAAVLAAQNKNAVVFGSQNVATMQEATKELQNIVYMEARISQLESANQNPAMAGVANTSMQPNSQIQQILSMLGNGGSGSGGNSLGYVVNFAKQNKNSELENLAKDTIAKINSLSASKSFESDTANQNSNNSSQMMGNVNPYANVTDINALKAEDQKATDKFMKLAKDQRSQEVADNMEKMLDQNGQKAGVLVLGAQHKDQLISAFNKKGISVIVITPDSEN